MMRQTIPANAARSDNVYRPFELVGSFRHACSSDAPMGDEWLGGRARCGGFRKEAAGVLVEPGPLGRVPGRLLLLGLLGKQLCLRGVGGDRGRGGVLGRQACRVRGFLRVCGGLPSGGQLRP